MITLYSAQACPFAQRTRALLEHLQEPYELREVDLDDRDPELLRLSPTGKVPFLVDGDEKLFESRVINDYLAAKLGHEQAYAEDVGLRALQQLLMGQWDTVVAPAFYRSLGDPDFLDNERREQLRKELRWMNRTVERLAADPVQDRVTDSLAQIHVATHWARMDWLREFTPLAGLVDEQPALRAWLDRAAQLPAVQKTLPDREATVQRYRERFAQR